MFSRGTPRLFYMNICNMCSFDKCLLRFVADHKEPTFEVIEELLMDKTIKFSKLAGQAPVLDRVKEELTKYWMAEANKGRSIEEYARSAEMIYWLHCFQLFRDDKLV